MSNKLPEKMDRNELLAYVRMLEAQVRSDGPKIEAQVRSDGPKIDFLNATVRRLEADAVLTIGALVQQMGGEAIIMPSVITDLSDYQIARQIRPEDGASIFRVRKKLTPEEQAALQAEVPATLPEELPVEQPATPFKPDGL